jgi:hypothetical protein
MGTVKSLLSHFDLGFLLTLVLFIVAAFIKGFSHELLLETGVLLVSVKLILVSQSLLSGTEKRQASQGLARWYWPGTNLLSILVTEFRALICVSAADRGVY